MKGRRIVLVQPPPGGAASGGTVFNAELVRAAREAGWPLTAIGCPRAGAIPACDLLIWDSLLLDQVQRANARHVALLLHYLPSSEPGLDAVQALRLRQVEDRAVRAADLLIVTGPLLAADAQARWRDKRIVLCEPGVASVFARRKPRTPAHPAVLLTVANLLPAKGHCDLLGVLEGLRDHAWHWHVLGHDPAGALSRQLRERARLKRLTGRLAFHGAVPQQQVAARMAAADVLLHPSLFESYGMVLAEAAAVGLPALAFDVGAARRLIRHGETGFVAPLGDWQGYAAHLRVLLAEPALRARFEHGLAAMPVRGWDAGCADFRSACEAVLS